MLLICLEILAPILSGDILALPAAILFHNCGSQILIDEVCQLRGEQY